MTTMRNCGKQLLVLPQVNLTMGVLNIPENLARFLMKPATFRAYLRPKSLLSATS